MNHKESFIIFILQFFVCNILFIHHVLCKWCHSLFHKIPKILIAKNNMHLLAPFLVILILHNWETRRKMPIQMIYCVMIPKNHRGCALDSRCWNFAKFLMWNFTKSWRILNQSWRTRINFSNWFLLLFFTLHSSE